MTHPRRFYWSLLWAGCLSFLFATVCPAQAEPGQDAPAQWYKGNTHTHTFWSDGNQFPEMAVDWYKANGYQFLALSDHNVLSEGEKWVTLSAMNKRVKDPDVDVIARCNERFGDGWVVTRQSEPNAEGETELVVRLRTLAQIRPMFEQPGAFLLIQAEEITESFEKKPVHTNALNLQRVIPKQDGESLRDLMRRQLLAVLAQEREIGQPILAHLNHPNFRWGVTAEDLAYVLEEEFFEVYNGHPSAKHFGDEHRPGDERIWDIVNTIRLGELKAPPMFAVATDDTHNYHSQDDASPGKGWIMVRAAELTPAALLTAMRQGDSYSSSGVMLRDIQYDTQTRTITIEIDPVPGESYTTVFRGTKVGYDAASREATDADGQALDATRVYSDSVGAVLATQTGTTVSYQLAGDELYVRATISSDHAPDNPSYENQLKQAWTQPIAWRHRVEDMGASQLHDQLP